MFRAPKTKKIIASLTLSAIVFVGVSAPIGPNGVQKSHAQLEVLGAMGINLGMDVVSSLLGGGLGGGFGARDVEIVFDSSPTGIARTASDIERTLLQTEETIKQRVLDPLFWGLTNATIANMLTTLTEWINGANPSGNPAFITDLEQYLQDEKDSAAIEQLENPGLDYICESIQVDVKTALKKHYAENRPSESADIARAQCTLDEASSDEEGFREGDFRLGGWGAWLRLTTNPENDPINALYQEIAKLDEEIQKTYERELTETAANGFFRNVEQCDSYDPVTKRGTNCKTTTPGSIVQQQLNDSLNMSRDRVVVADELDELIAAVFSQFANQAIVGINGLLGLGGNDQYTDNRFGSTGDQSYLAALGEEAAENIAGSNVRAKLTNAIEKQVEYAEILLATNELIDELASTTEEARATEPSCSSVFIPAELTSIRNNNNTRLEAVAAETESLLALYEQLLNATTNEERAAVAIEVGTRDIQSNSQIDISIQIAQSNLDKTVPDLIEPITESLEQCLEGDVATEGSGNGFNDNTPPTTTNNGTDI